LFGKKTNNNNNNTTTTTTTQKLRWKRFSLNNNKTKQSALLR